MANQVQLMEVLKKEVGSLLIDAKEGLTPTQLEQEYLATVGKPLPLRELGFRYTMELMANMFDTVRICAEKGSLVLKAAPAVEMPLLEPICETKSFHLTAEKKSEPAEKQLPQELELALLENFILTPEIPWDAVQDSSLCGLPPLKSTCMVGVLMGFIVSPSQFYIHVRIRATRDELLDMMIDMRGSYSDKHLSDRYIMPESSVRPGQLCCLMVANWWYRVIVHQVLSHHEVEVFYVDYGNLETVQKSELRFLKCCYSKLPAQAIPCSLAGVKPLKGTWSNAATVLFRKLCGSEILVGIVDEYLNGVLHLFLCDTSTNEDVYFHRVLSEQGHAHLCEENIPSQGFLELNPLAMYVQPHGQQENTELVKPDLHLQQESPRANSKLYMNRLRDQVDEEEVKKRPSKVPFSWPVECQWAA